MKAKFLAAAGAAAVMMAGAAWAQYSEPMYHITFYSDATETEVVGYGRPGCGPQGVTYEYEGEQTAFRRDDLIATCGPDGIQLVQQ